MTALTMGIDPGRQGAIAFLDPTGALVHLEDMPDHQGPALGTQLAMLIADLEPEQVGLAVVELQTIRPGQAGASRMMTNYGALLGALGALRIPTVTYTPGAWKVASGLRGKDKGASRSLATATWPGWAESFRRVKDDGRAEAALVARHGQKEAQR